MKCFEFIAIFLTPIFGLTVAKKENSIERLIQYFKWVVTSNLITNIFLYYYTDYMLFDFTNSFFIKYSLFNIFVIILIKIIKENVKIEIRKKK